MTGNHLNTHALTLAIALSAGCQASAPSLNDRPTRTPDGGGSNYADWVTAFTQGGASTACTDEPNILCAEQEGECTGHPAVGSPDGNRFLLDGDGLLELGFLCAPIIDRADGSDAPVPDFRIHATVPSGSSATVAISDDGSNYVTIPNLTRDGTQDFFITDGNFSFVRFVRISGLGGTDIEIDAVEVLP